VQYAAPAGGVRGDAALVVAVAPGGRVALVYLQVGPCGGAGRGSRGRSVRRASLGSLPWARDGCVCACRAADGSYTCVGRTRAAQRQLTQAGAHLVEVAGFRTGLVGRAGIFTRPGSEAVSPCSSGTRWPPWMLPTAQSSPLLRSQ
jgi:hypothetical protein